MKTPSSPTSSVFDDAWKNQQALSEALTSAVLVGNCAEADRLIMAGADPEFKTDQANQRTLDNASVSAIFDSNPNKLKCLLSAGANPNYRDMRENLTSLDRSVKLLQPASRELTRVLMKHGADPNSTTKDAQGKRIWTPLMYSCLFDGKDTLFEILNSDGPIKVDILAYQNYQLTAFVTSAIVIARQDNWADAMGWMQEYFEEKVWKKTNEQGRCLLEKSHLWLSTNSYGQNAFMHCLCIENMQWILDQNFIEPEKLIEKLDNGGWSALWWAVSRVKREIVEFLLSRGAKVDGSDTNGQTFFEFAEIRAETSDEKDSKEILSHLKAVDASRKALAAVDKMMILHCGVYK